MTDLRFDDAYEKVSVYDNDAEAYVFCGTYFAFGITTEMSDSEKAEVVERDLCLID